MTGLKESQKISSTHIKRASEEEKQNRGTELILKMVIQKSSWNKTRPKLIFRVHHVPGKMYPGMVNLRQSLVKLLYLFIFYFY